MGSGDRAARETCENRTCPRYRSCSFLTNTHTKFSRLSSHLLLGLEDVAPEGVAGAVSGNVAENLQVLRVVRHVEYPGKKKKKNN